MDRKQAKAAWVSTLGEEMTLTPFDYTAPQNYIMKCFGFPFDDSERQAAVRHLEARLHLAFKFRPSLAGQIIHGKDGKLPKLVYPVEHTNNNLHTFPDEVFDHLVLDESQFPWTFEHLTQAGAPASTFGKDLLWLLPQSGPAPGDACHPITLRASFIKGGLILGFAFHHGVMDGTGTAAFLTDFCLNAGGEYNVRMLEYTPTPDDSTMLTVQDINSGLRMARPFINHANLHHRKRQVRELAARTSESIGVVDVHSTPGYDFTVPATPPVIPTAIAKVLTISASRATALHTEALAHIRSTHGPNTFISITDTVCALTWLHITRVRLRAGRIQPDDPTRFATAINMRREFAMTHLPGYIGNMFLRGLASSTVGDMVQHPTAPATPAQVARAALLIRQAVQTIMNDEDGARKKHIAIAHAATNPEPSTNQQPHVSWPEVDAAIRRAISRHSTGVDATVGVTLGADIVFDIPGVAEGGMKPAWVRRAYVPHEGFMGVLPRRGGAKGDADWEVWLGMREEDMDVLVGEGELGGWLCRPPA